MSSLYKPIEDQLINEPQLPGNDWNGVGVDLSPLSVEHLDFSSLDSLDFLTPGFTITDDTDIRPSGTFPIEQSFLDPDIRIQISNLNLLQIRLEQQLTCLSNFCTKLEKECVFPRGPSVVFS